MAVSTATTFNDVVYAAIITDRILQELRPYNVSRGLFRFMEAGPSKVAQFPTFDDPGPVTDALTEGTDYSTVTTQGTGNAQVTAGEVGMRSDVTDFLVKISILDVMPQVTGALARSLAEKFETDCSALYDDFSNVTTAAAGLTPQDHLAAVSALEQRDVTGSLVAVYHPKQAGELRAELAATTAVVHSGGANAGGLVSDHLEGSVGTLYGVPILQTSLVVSASGLRGGAVFVRGEALGAYEIWGPRIELQRDASARNTEIVATQCYGVAEISDTRGQTVKSAA